MAIDIINPFPFLSVPLSEVFPDTPSFLQDLLKAIKFSSIIQLMIILFGTILALKTTKIEDEQQEEIPDPKTLKELRDDALKNLRLMTLLPIAAQFWVMVATDQLISLGHAIAIGLFILSGPASWQLTIRVVMFSKDRRSGLKQISVTAIFSLIGTIVATYFGLLLKHQPNLVDTAILPYLASFSLVIVPYSFFYSHWGEKWRDARPLGTIIAIIIFSMFSFLVVSDQIAKLITLLLAWFVLLAFPYVIYSQEFLSEDFQCQRCARAGRTPQYRTYRGRKYCLTCRDKVPIERALIEEKCSLQSWFYLLFLVLFLKPSAGDVGIEIDPTKGEYNIGENVKIKVDVTHRAKLLRNHPIICKVNLEPRFEKTPMTTEESDVKLIDPDTTMTFIFNWSIPQLVTKKAPKPTEKIAIVAKVSILGCKPKDRDELYSPRAFHTKQISSLTVKMVADD